MGKLKKIRVTIEMNDDPTLAMYENSPISEIIYDFLREHESSREHGDKVLAEKIFEK